jgi:hypothetical protein
MIVAVWGQRVGGRGRREASGVAERGLGCRERQGMLSHRLCSDRHSARHSALSH